MVERLLRILGTFLTALAVAAPAQAASVSVTSPYCALEQSKYGACYPDEAHFKATDGEVNHVVITRSVDPPTYAPRATFTDSGAPVTAAAGCTQIDEHSASCTGYLLVAFVDAGDGDDNIDGPGTLNGGPGNDTLKGDFALVGGPGDDRLEGGDQGESLQGGPGIDTLMGGAGNDTLQPDDGEVGEADVVDGGEGNDVASYRDRKDALVVSLEQPAGNEDQLTGIEGIRGGSGRDALTGDAGPNTLEGGDGGDLLKGGDGDDVIDGGAGADEIAGGLGNDRLFSGRDRLPGNRLACGDGVDQADPGPNTLVTDDCEDLTGSNFELVGKLRLLLPQASRRSPVLALDDASCFDRPCIVKMSLTMAAGPSRGKVVGARTVTLRRRRQKLPRHLSLSLNATGRRLLKAGPLRVQARVTVNEAFDIARTSFVVLLGPS